MSPLSPMERIDRTLTAIDVDKRPFNYSHPDWLTHWGRVTHICDSELTIIGSDDGLSPGRHQAIIWTNAGILLFGPLETNFSEIFIEILTISFKKMRLKVSSAKWRPFCLSLNVLTYLLTPFRQIQPEVGWGWFVKLSCFHWVNDRNVIMFVWSPQRRCI